MFIRIDSTVTTEDPSGEFDHAVSVVRDVYDRTLFAVDAYGRNPRRAIAMALLKAADRLLAENPAFPEKEEQSNG